AMVCTDPLSSMSLPNSAPSRKIGKNCAMNCAALPMNVCVQWASRGSRAVAAATKATAGARRSTLQPRKESQMRSPRAASMPRSPITSDLLQQNVQVDGRLLAYVRCLGTQERVCATSPFIAQHAQKVPFGVEFGRRSKCGKHGARDQVNAHV